MCEWRSQLTYKLACDAPEPSARSAAPEPSASDLREEEEEEGDGKRGGGVGGLKDLQPAFGGTRAVVGLVSALVALVKSFS